MNKSMCVQNQETRVKRARAFHTNATDATCEVDVLPRRQDIQTIEIVCKVVRVADT